MVDGHFFPTLIDFATAFTYILLPYLLGLIHFGKFPSKQQKKNVIFLYYLVISVGIQGIYTGFWQVFYPQHVAEFLKWPNSPFLAELGAANIAFGILGVLCPIMDVGWKAAAAINYSLFLFLTGIMHIVNNIRFGLSSGDFGAFVISDITVAAILIFCLIQNLRG